MESAGPVASRIAGKPQRSSFTGNTFATDSKADAFLFDWLGNRNRATAATVGARLARPGPGYREEHRPSALGDGLAP